MFALKTELEPYLENCRDLLNELDLIIIKTQVQFLLISIVKFVCKNE